MHMRKFLVPAALAMMGAPVVAHDFWIQPEQFVLDEPDTIPVSLFVGHGQDRSRWGVAPDHVTMFETVGPDGSIDRRASLRLPSREEDAQIALAQPGGYLFGLRSRSSSSTLPSEQFNDYVEKEGITPIADYRARQRRQKQEGRELYSRRAKAIVQIGPVDQAAIERVTAPLDLDLEIVPGLHPQALEGDRMLPVTVMYGKKPLSGALVKLTDLSSDAEPITMHRTNSDGKARFEIPQAGNWQLNVVWSEPLNGDTRADFQTIFSSLSFATR